MKVTFQKAFIVASQSSWTVFGLLGASFLIVLLLHFTPFEVRDYVTSNAVGTVLLNASIYILAVLIVLAPMFKRHSHGDIKKLLGIAERLKTSGVAKALLGWMVYFVLSILVSLAVGLVPGFNSNQVQDVGFGNLTLIYEYIAAFIGLVILPPIAEELLFRGYLFGQLRRNFGFAISAVVTSAIFGLVHMQWNVGVDVFVLSLVLCYLRENTGSIWAGMIVHGMKNGLAYFVIFIVPLIHSSQCYLLCR